MWPGSDGCSTPSTTTWEHTQVSTFGNVPSDGASLEVMFRPPQEKHGAGGKGSGWSPEAPHRWATPGRGHRTR